MVKPYQQQLAEAYSKVLGEIQDELNSAGVPTHDPVDGHAYSLQSRLKRAIISQAGSKRA